MAIRKKEELLESLKAIIGDDSTDEALSILEDITDTVSDYENRIQETGDWKSKYEENDRTWREKYKERFFSGEEQHEGAPSPTSNELGNDDINEPSRFEDLFTTN